MLFSRAKKAHLDNRLGGLMSSNSRVFYRTKLNFCLDVAFESAFLIRSEFKAKFSSAP